MVLYRIIRWFYIKSFHLSSHMFKAQGRKSQSIMALSSPQEVFSNALHHAKGSLTRPEKASLLVGVARLHGLKRGCTSTKAPSCFTSERQILIEHPRRQDVTPNQPTKGYSPYKMTRQNNSI